VNWDMDKCTALTAATDNGSLTEAELRTALVNGDWSPFDPHTVRMMIRYASLVKLALRSDLRSAECLTPTALARSILTSFGTSPVPRKEFRCLTQPTQWLMGLPICMA
jgi:hypothetical protein